MSNSNYHYTYECSSRLNLPLAVDTWKHHFSAECMSVVHDQAFGAKTPGYQTILQLDRKLRAFPVPPVLQVAGFGNSDPNANHLAVDSLGLIMQRHIVLAIREMSEFSGR